MAAGQVTVISGAGSLSAANLVCMTISQIRTSVSDVLTVDRTAAAFVNGMAVTEDYKAKAGDQVTFSRPVGTKG